MRREDGLTRILLCAISVLALCLFLFGGCSDDGKDKPADGSVDVQIVTEAGSDAVGDGEVDTGATEGDVGTTVDTGKIETDASVEADAAPAGDGA